MSFQQGLSGLNTAARHLEVIGNNVANASVVGYKVQEMHFADVFANSLAGVGTGQFGIGVKVGSVAQAFNQGTISVTDNPLDIAINGKGFYRLDENGAVSYARNGQFHIDKDGYIVNDQRLKLTGYGVDAAGTIVPSAPIPLRISNADLPPVATSSFDVGLNLNSNHSAIASTITFDPSDTDSFNDQTSATVYDTLGNAHIFSMYFRKTAANSWEMYGTVDSGSPSSVTFGTSTAGSPISLTFDEEGALDPFTPVSVSFPVTTGATSPMSFTFDPLGTTQFAGNFSVNSMVQDGVGPGRLAALNISEEGVIMGRYTNGRNRNLAQLVLADFRNPQGLKPLGNNQWEETADSGLPLVGVPNSGPLGVVQSGAVEDSTVDLTAELVDMITAQRIYQANAQTIKTQDQVLQTLVNLR